ncbi:MAG: hypothetical protein HUK40_19140 [Desulfobacter sp.]|nr:hypothetical protein [Desulfobacter sp.]
MYLRSARPSEPLPNLETLKQKIQVGLSLKAFPEKTAFYFARGMARI